MAQVEQKQDFARDLKTIVLRGAPTFREFAELAMRNFEAPVSKNIIWDARDADFSALSNDEFKGLARLAPEQISRRAGGKTALVVCGDLEFGLSRMLEAFLYIERLPFVFRPFRTMEEAEQWIFPPDVED